MEFKIKYKVELDDFIRFCKFAQRKSLLIYFALYLVFIAIITRSADIKTKIFMFFFSIILYLLFCTIDIKIKAKRAYKSDKTMQEESELTINENGITEKSPKTEIKIDFTDILKVEEDKYAIYIFIGNSRAYMIPKRFINEEEQKRVKEILKIGMNKIK